MSLAALMRSMADAGATLEAIILAVEAIEAREEAERVKRRAAADRKARQRAREREPEQNQAETGMSRDSRVTVTGQSRDTPLSPPNAPHTPQTPPLYPPDARCFTPVRATPVDPVAIGLRQEIAAAYERRGALPPATHDVAMWLKLGYSPDLVRSVVIHAIDTRQSPPKTLSYFAGKLAEEHARILAEMARPPPVIAPRPATAAPARPGGRSDKGGLIAAMDRMQADAQTDDSGQLQGTFRVVSDGTAGRPGNDSPRLLVRG